MGFLWNSIIFYILEILWAWCMGCGPQLGVSPPWTCRGDGDAVRRRRARERLRWSGVRRTSDSGDPLHIDTHNDELGRRPNGDEVEWWEEWPRPGWPFYSSRGREADCPGRVVGSGGVDLMIRFRLEREGDGTKRCRKMKQRGGDELVLTP
jgi:hypothetical protein